MINNDSGANNLISAILLGIPLNITIYTGVLFGAMRLFTISSMLDEFRAFDCETVTSSETSV